MSFSDGLLAGYRVASGIIEREDRLKQQEIDNAFLERQLGLKESADARVQSQFDFGRNVDALEGDFEVLDTGGAPRELDMESYFKDVETSGQVPAIGNLIKNQFGGDTDAFFKDPIGQQVALSVLNNSASFNARAHDGTDAKATKLVPVNNNGEEGFVIGMENPDGSQGVLSQNRRKGEQDAVYIPKDNLVMQVTQGLREQGAFSDPKNIQVMDELGIDVEATLAALDGQDFNSIIPPVTKLTAAKAFARPTKQVSGKQLNDGTKREPFKTNFERKLSDADKPNLTNATLSEKLGQVQPQDTISTDSIVDKIASIPDDFGAIVGSAESAIEEGTSSIKALDKKASEKGLIPALKEDAQFLESVNSTIDTFKEVASNHPMAFLARGAAKAKTYLFGPDKENDKSIVTNIKDSSPEKVASAEEAIVNQIKDVPPAERTLIGKRDTEALLKTYRQSRSQSGKPNGRQLAIATRLVANGLLPPQSLATYRETGKFTLDDARLAAIENSNRVNALKAQTAYQKMVNGVGKEQADRAKQINEDSYGSVVGAFASHLVNNPKYVSKMDALGYKPEDYSKSILDGAMNDPRIASAVTGRAGASRYEMTGEHMSRVARALQDILGKHVTRAQSNFFTRDVDEANPYSDSLAEELLRALKPKK